MVNLIERLRQRLKTTVNPVKKAFLQRMINSLQKSKSTISPPTPSISGSFTPTPEVSETEWNNIKSVYNQKLQQLKEIQNSPEGTQWTYNGKTYNSRDLGVILTQEITAMNVTVTSSDGSSKTFSPVHNNYSDVIGYINSLHQQYDVKKSQALQEQSRQPFQVVPTPGSQIGITSQGDVQVGNKTLVRGTPEWISYQTNRGNFVGELYNPQTQKWESVALDRENATLLKAYREAEDVVNNGNTVKALELAISDPGFAAWKNAYDAFTRPNQTPAQKEANRQLAIQTYTEAYYNRFSSTKSLSGKLTYLLQGPAVSTALILSGGKLLVPALTKGGLTANIVRGSVTGGAGLATTAAVVQGIQGYQQEGIRGTIPIIGSFVPVVVGAKLLQKSISTNPPSYKPPTYKPTISQKIFSKITEGAQPSLEGQKGYSFPVLKQKILSLKETPIIQKYLGYRETLRTTVSGREIPLSSRQFYGKQATGITKVEGGIETTIYGRKVTFFGKGHKTRIPYTEIEKYQPKTTVSVSAQARPEQGVRLLYEAQKISIKRPLAGKYKIIDQYQSLEFYKPKPPTKPVVWLKEKPTPSKPIIIGELEKGYVGSTKKAQFELTERTTRGYSPEAFKAIQKEATAVSIKKGEITFPTESQYQTRIKSVISEYGGKPSKFKFKLPAKRSLWTEEAAQKLEFRPDVYQKVSQGTASKQIFKQQQIKDTWKIVIPETPLLMKTSYAQQTKLTPSYEVKLIPLYETKVKSLTIQKPETLLIQKPEQISLVISKQEQASISKQETKQIQIVEQKQELITKFVQEQTYKFKQPQIKLSPIVPPKKKKRKQEYHPIAFVPYSARYKEREFKLGTFKIPSYKPQKPTAKPLSSKVGIIPLKINKIKSRGI